MALNNTYFETKGRDITTPIPDTPGYVPPSPPSPPSPDPGSVPSITPPVFSGNTSVALYVNSSEKNRVDKVLSSVFSDTIVIKDNVDIIFTAGGGVNNGAWESCIENNIKAITN